MSNPNKRKGTAWESRLRDWFRTQGAPHCERLALSGSQDRGDLTGMPGVCIEAKNAKALDLAGWVDELDAEMVNAGAEVGAVMFPRRNRTVDQAYALMPASVFARLLRQAGWLSRPQDASGAPSHPSEGYVVPSKAGSDRGAVCGRTAPGPDSNGELR